ncbi:uncharacterized protein LOC144617709 [Crassostrea virginica]
MLLWIRTTSKMITIHPNFIPLLLMLWIQGHKTESVQYSHLDCRYQFHVQGLTWMEAYNVCKDKNMTLLHLNDLNEFSTIQSLHSQVNGMISSTIESAWFGLHVTSQSDGVHYFGLDCQHPSLSSHLKTTVLDSSTMCGMFNRSGADHDYQYQVIGCNKSLPYVCEETQSGSVPCFLKLEDLGKQLTVEHSFHFNNIEACAEHCFNSSRPGFVYEGPNCMLLKSQPNGELNPRDGYYTNKIIDWVSSAASIDYTIPPEEVCSIISSPAVLSTSSMAETMSIFSLDPSSLSHVTSDTSSSTTPSLQTTSETTFSLPITSILSSTSPCYCPCRLVRNVSLTPVELQKKIEKMKSELTIPTKKTNKYQRSLTSAPDNRPSARGLGSLGIVIIGIIVTMLIAFDFPRAARSAVNIAHKAKRKSRKQRTA